MLILIIGYNKIYIRIHDINLKNKGGMFMINDNPIVYRYEVLDMFDTSEVRDLINEQIPIENNNDTFLNITQNYFAPIYKQYKDALSNAVEDMIPEINRRFYEICNIYITRICKKFDLELDNGWISDNINQVPAITMVLYSFFYLDFKNNLKEMLLNYILKNKSSLYKAFEGCKGRKDATSIMYKRSTIDDKMSLLLANIYNVNKYILNQIETDDYLELLGENECSCRVVSNLMKHSVLTGDFINTIREIYESNIPLKSNIGFEIVEDIINIHKEEE